MTSEDEIDMMAVQRDDALLDALAGRRPLPESAAGDRVAGLLAALAADVDEGLAPPESPFAGFLTAVPQHGAGTEVVPESEAQAAGQSRRIGPRTVIALSVAGAIFSASGVAAAVSGNPLAPIHRMITSVTDEKPDPARTPAQVTEDLDGADKALKGGDTETARRKLEQAKKNAAKLSGPAAAAAMERVRQLENQLALQDPSAAPTPSAPAVPGPGNTATPSPSDTLTDKEKRAEERRKQREERRKQREEKQQKKPGAGTPSPTPSSLASIESVDPAPSPAPSTAGLTGSD